jgi:hypothetical protein
MEIMNILTGLIDQELTEIPVHLPHYSFFWDVKLRVIPEKLEKLMCIRPIDINFVEKGVFSTLSLAGKLFNLLITSWFL